MKQFFLNLLMFAILFNLLNVIDGKRKNKGTVKKSDPKNRKNRMKWLNLCSFAQGRFS